VRVTVKVMVPADSSTETSSAAIEIEVWSSLSLMSVEAAAVPIAGVTRLPCGLESVTVTVSVVSSSRSSVRLSVMILTVSPSAKVTEPVPASLTSEPSAVPDSA